MKYDVGDVGVISDGTTEVPAKIVSVDKKGKFPVLAIRHLGNDDAPFELDENFQFKNCYFYIPEKVDRYVAHIFPNGHISQFRPIDSQTNFGVPFVAAIIAEMRDGKYTNHVLRRVDETEEELKNDFMTKMISMFTVEDSSVKEK